ncbi:bifunctional DNA primase/polymerase [Streptomyces caniscabiei]|uniref:Bifunctional DNA primase/polymerase n=1 Tax=Streptomyces caniscabiei TaxID=2746961 RepID=A0ABU4N1S0_9ACTN|nr:bifunctional DNA primase/polymerase [Streptomyces caniscabiei]MBE4740467.1 bifunctional DNA primase/polymerase [Streptomyces caniscabiei]MBE4761278.1 bifunctional DNA primase/polymerase [Streptomyces caniscabiei]MBE4773429.1 bifunctional DNA primase/polymerase [Streptomyces caniscabiei]MBE4790124.1 bifunctional DNA primase/polymerase [Streptomyces caniscabiei]MBE4799288.1 bifunctional DNA primase/polymerase [Streptomyces caniscabiei]
MSEHLMRAALEAAERGWHVFPLRPGGKPPALHGEKSCTRAGECARGHRKWEQRATTDPDRIRAAWSRAPFNVGIATGPSGLVVVDLDVPKDKGSSDAPDGAATFAALCERAGHRVPDTYQTRTASGGEHLYFTAPAGVRLANTAGTIGALVDTRAWGGYVVAAGSTTPTGDYEPLSAPVTAPLPVWLLSILQPAPKPPQAPSGPVTAQSRRYADVALAAETRNVAGAQVGGRETALFRAARALGRFVAWGDLPRHTVEQALQEAGEAAGLTVAECRSTLRSALNWSIAHNQHGRNAA